MNAQNSTAVAYPKTLVEAIRYFADTEVALNFWVDLRWPDGVFCPRCGSTDVRFLGIKYARWECKGQHDRRQFTVKVGTIMEDSPLSLDKWAVAMWLEANAKNSISSYEIHRALGITQKSAWFMQHRIRLAMQDGSTDKLSGTVEVDETFIGGKARNMHKHKRAEKIKGTGGMGKTAVMGLLARHGEKGKSTVRAKVIGSTKRATLHPLVKENVEAGSNVYTDALKSYDALNADFVHEFIDHAECYARGAVHTNGLENFWSLFKRCIKGTHVSVEPFHLFRYLDAEAFRFNNRSVKDADRFTAVASGIEGKRLTYKQLIGATEVPPNASTNEGQNGGLLN